MGKMPLCRPPGKHGIFQSCVNPCFFLISNYPIRTLTHIELVTKVREKGKWKGWTQGDLLVSIRQSIDTGKVPFSLTLVPYVISVLPNTHQAIFRGQLNIL